MINSKYAYCESCLWSGNCENTLTDMDLYGDHTCAGQCDDYSPIDRGDEISDYQSDLEMRARAYASLIEEFQ